MADEYKKISGTEETCGSTGVQQKYVDLTGDGHAQSVYVEDGQLDVTLVVGDIEIGAVELKDATTANRAAITAAGDVQVTLASEVVDVDATGQGDVPVTLDGEAVVLGAGAAAIGKLAANSGVDIGDVTVNNIAGSGAYVQPGTSTTWDVSDRAARALGKLGANTGVDIGDVDVLSIAAGANIIGKVGIDQTTPGTTNKVVASVASGGIASGAVASGAVASGAIVDGADVAEGATADAAVITDTTGTVSGKLRGLVKWAFERMPASLGQKAMTASLPVTIASDDTLVSEINAFLAPLYTNTNHFASATNDVATVTLAAGGADVFNVIREICWSYDDDPTGGMITIYDDGLIVGGFDITAGGPGFVPFSNGLANAVANKTMSVELAAAGGTIVGKLNVHAGTV